MDKYAGSVKQTSAVPGWSDSMDYIIGALILLPIITFCVGLALGGRYGAARKDPEGYEEMYWP